MKSLKKRLGSAVLSIALILTLSVQALGYYENVHVNTGSQSEDIARVALTQLGYTEGKNNLTKYGEWYETILKLRNLDPTGFKNGAWCAMYTSWCANQAAIKETTVPYYALCADGVEAFKKAKQWHDSSYTPKPGDIVFFDWNVNNYADHTGIVMYAENGMLYSIEGNTSVNRRDKGTNSSSSTAPDLCMVRQRDLSDKYILGYATPDYSGAAFDSKDYNGIIDLESDQKKVSLMALSDNVMDKTGSYTFGPYYGMTRGEFADFLCRVFQLNADISGTQSFSDVPASHDYYKAIMTLRKLGLTSGSGNNTYTPDVYLTVTEGKFMMQAVCKYVGLTMPDYDYEGDAAGKYLRRFEAAQLYSDIAMKSVSLSSLGQITVTDLARRDYEMPAILLYDDAYVRLSDWNRIMANYASESVHSTTEEASSTSRWVREGNYTVKTMGPRSARMMAYQNEPYFNLSDLADNMNLQAASGSETHFTLMKESVAVASDVRPAILHDYSGTLKDNELYTPGSYSVTATVPAGQSTVSVEIRAEEIQSYTNAAGTKGYWTGMAILAPEGAAAVRYNTTGSAQNLQNGTISDNADGIDRGLIVWFDVTNEPKNAGFFVQWLSANGTVLSQTAYSIDLSHALKETNYVAPFKDVPKTAWYAEAVKYVKSNGMMDGTGADTFGPSVKFSRAMVAQVVYAMEGKPATSATGKFKDISDGQWFAPAVNWCSEHGIVSGYTTGNYGPNDPITREQLVAILYKYAQYRNADTTARGDLSQYTDTATISFWALDSMQWAEGSGLISGRENKTLAPKGTAVRCEVAQILMNFHKKYMVAG